MKKLRAATVMFLVLIFNLSFICDAAQQMLLSVVFTEKENVVEYEIRISENSNMAALNFEVTYNTEVLRYISYETSVIYNSGINQINDTQEGKIVCAFISAVAVVEGGSFLRFKFEVNEGQTVKYDDFCFNIKEVADTSGKNIDYKIECIDFPTNPFEHNGASSEVTLITGKTDAEVSTTINPTNLNVDDAKKKESTKGGENADEIASPEPNQNTDILYVIIGCVLGTLTIVAIVIIVLLKRRGGKRQ